MQKKRITLPDGRYLIYYEFDDEERAQELRDLISPAVWASEKS